MIKMDVWGLLSRGGGGGGDIILEEEQMISQKHVNTDLFTFLQNN